MINGAGFGGAVDYIMGKEAAELLDSNGVRDYDKKLITKDFELISKQNERVTKPVMHLTLSFSPEDNLQLNNQKMLAISKRVIDDMGYSNSQYIIVKHNDTKHPHVHILLNRVDLNLNTVDNSYSKMKLNKIRIEIENTYPELTKAEGKNIQQSNPLKLKGSDKVKYKIYNAINIEIHNVINIESLIKNLEKNHSIITELKYRRGSIDFVDGIKFHSDNTWLSGSKIDKSCSYLNLLKQISNTQLNSKIVTEKTIEAKMPNNINIASSIAKSISKDNGYDNAVKRKRNWTNDNEIER